MFATGTPVANTLAEVFVMMRYLQNDLLERLGLEFFDVWAATFAQVQMAFELRPDGSGFRMNTRLSRFVNLPELATLWRQCLNVRTAEQLNLPRPKLVTGKPISVVIPPAPRLKAFVASLVERVEKIKNRQVDPCQDNMLKITGEGRLAALDIRLVMGGPAEPDCKINALVEWVTRIYRESDAQAGTQLIFCDLSTPKGSRDTAPKDEGGAGATDESSAQEQGQQGFVYHEIRQKLIARGIPHAEVAFIHEHATKSRREALFADVRAGRVRVLIGSTAKMGTGMNVQERLVALHHLDAPWRPCDIEQREGRILRQGNRWPEVSIYQYVTEGSFDGYLWQLLENKARFISQVMAGEITQRTADDVAEVVLTAAEIKALASGNPKVIQKVRLDAELGRLDRVRSVWLNSRFDAQREMTRNEHTIAALTSDIAALRQAITVRDAHAGPFALTVVHPNGTSAVYTERAAAGEAVRKAMRVWLAHDLTTTRNHSTTTVRSIGAYRGLTLEFQLHWFRGEPKEPELSVVLEHDGQRWPLAGVTADTDTGTISSLDYHIRTLEEQVAGRQRQQRELEQRQAELATSVARQWEGAATYQRVVRELERLNAELSEADVPASMDAADAEMDELMAEARALTAAPAPDPIAPAIDVGSAVRAAPDGPAGLTQSVKVALSKAVAILPAPLLDTHPTPPPPQLAPSAPEHPDPIPPPRSAAIAFGDHAWIRPPRRKPATAPVPAEQLRLFE